MSSNSEDMLLKLATASKHTTFTREEQLIIVKQMLKNGLAVVRDSELKVMINQHLEALNDLESFHEEQWRALNKFLVQVEQQAEGHSFITYLKQQGFYRMFYHTPHFQGKELPQDDILRKLLRSGLIGVGFSSLFILLFLATSLLSAPAWLTVIATGLFTGSCAYIGGIMYGVVNDLFASNANLPYFMLGHQPQQQSLLRTNDASAVGIAWGIAASYPLVAIASVVFAVAATMTAAFVPLATFMLPAILIAMPMVAVGAEFYARKRAKVIAQEGYGSGYNKILPGELEDYCGANRYQQDGLAQMCPTIEEKATWFANSDRNVFGFTKVPFIGVGGLVSLIGLSAASGLLPAASFGMLLSVTIPVIGAGIGAAFLIGCGIYMYANQNYQHDNRFKMAFDSDEYSKDPGLYLEQENDITLAHTLIKEHQLEQTQQQSNGNVYSLEKTKGTANVVLEEEKNQEMEQEHPLQNTL